MYTEPPCDRCDGLCCRVYDIFDTTSGRQVKTGDQKCGYLDNKNQCRIHTTRHLHAGYRDSCASYDCLGGGEIITIFSRRIPGDTPQRSAIISSLLETVRLSIQTYPHQSEEILLYTAILLNNISIDTSLLIHVKSTRAKIELWRPKTEGITSKK